MYIWSMLIYDIYNYSIIQLYVKLKIIIKKKKPAAAGSVCVVVRQGRVSTRGLVGCAGPTETVPWSLLKFVDSSYGLLNDEVIFLFFFAFCYRSFKLEFCAFRLFPCVHWCPWFITWNVNSINCGNAEAGGEALPLNALSSTLATWNWIPRFLIMIIFGPNRTSGFKSVPLCSLYINVVNQPSLYTSQ